MTKEWEMLYRGLQRHGSHDPVLGWEVLLFLQQSVMLWSSGIVQLFDCGESFKYTVWFLRLDQH